ncbi:MAG: cell division protease FtsH, partial [Sediminicola sp.]
MAKENNTSPKKPKFSSWWIYGLIAMLLIGFQFFGSGNFNSTKKTTSSELQEYLRNGDIS